MKLIPSAAMPIWMNGLKVITSRCGSCQRSLALRHLSAQNVGIRMHGTWYCSARCFRWAAEQEVLRLLKPVTEQAARVSRMPLGLNLISQGLLTVEQLKKATEEQKEAGGEIGELLVRQGAVSEKQVTAVRATEWGCPVFAVPKQAIRVGIDLPSTLMRSYSMIPVHYAVRTNLLLVGFVHTVEYGLLYAIEQITECETKPCFVTPSDFQTQLQQQQKEQEQSELTPAREEKFEDIQTAAEIAGTLCTSGLEIEADEAFIGKCKDYLWVRLKNRHQAIDLLFRSG
jgi:Type II secretion system (T2SS), protein E, N-terminal domain